MSTHWRDGRLLPITWSIETGDGPLQGPLALEFLRGRRLELVLAPGQQALLLDADRLRAVYGPGRHELDIGDGPHGLDPRWRLLFLAFGDGLRLDWTAGAELYCGPRGETAVSGLCEVTIASPEAFHGTFLAGVARPETSFVLTLIDRLVRSVVASALDPAVADAAAPTAPAERLAGLRPADLATDLAPCGLACRQVALAPAGPRDLPRREAPATAAAPVPGSGQSGGARRH